MITPEQYEEAKRIVEQYERERLPDLEDQDENYDEHDSDPLEREYEECTCGAYVVSSKTGSIIKISDCYC